MEMSSKHNVMRVPNFLGGKKCKLLQNNFFIDSKRRHFIERSHYDDERNPYCERFLEPIPLLFWYLSVIVWESVPGAKTCGQPIWLKLGTEVGCHEIFQKPIWLTSLTLSFRVSGGVSFFALWAQKNPSFQGSFWKCHKTQLVNCAAKWIWLWIFL